MANDIEHPPLAEEHAVFLREHVTINVAGRDAKHIATITRAAGCRVSDDRRRVTVFLAAQRCPALLDNLRDNGAIAVVAVRPSTHQSIQLKGVDAVIGLVREDDRALMGVHVEQFVAELARLGHAERFARMVIPPQTDDIVAVTFTPLNVFQQTPGPGAGRRL
ncbi:MAG: hypothetical protein AB1810_13470 [Pseudomonadota bacterium]